MRYDQKRRQDNQDKETHEHAEQRKLDKDETTAQTRNTTRKDASLNRNVLESLSDGQDTASLTVL